MYVFSCAKTVLHPPCLSLCLEMCRNFFGVNVPGELSRFEAPRSRPGDKDFRASHVLGRWSQKTLLGEYKWDGEASKGCMSWPLTSAATRAQSGDSEREWNIATEEQESWGAEPPNHHSAVVERAASRGIGLWHFCFTSWRYQVHFLARAS